MKIKGIKIKEETHTALLKKQIEVMEKTGDKPNIVDLASDLIEKGLDALDDPQMKALKPKK
ncbi:hypothetical protein [Thermoflexibacter ruber]|jgi:hypothetical protein|uniref:Uncharacterized protein n=1 Tax=Thermoflexibacter ruber TaxID=1003 RepID=A0A1I2J0U2_9BACT|nr:hypothetical protein [Thermoflexibacter ruber]MCU0390441.1 hypothetical protein [Thermoflexibacter sp.]SFF48094.1 hypothetical protein SAMN04488541_10403 [Thermoflexibacter ruber]